MLRFLLCALGLAALAPSAASAAPFGELPFRAVTGTATCLRATGAPGELVRRVARGAEFLQATPAGVAATGTLAGQSGESGCPQVAARPSGAGVYAFLASTDGEPYSVHAYVREAGGGW